jgi:DedD protein
LQQDPQEVSKGRKRRVVGTIVLLALALIILPQLFDGEGGYQPQVESRIPERPIITLLPQPQQSRPVMVGDVPSRAVVDNPTVAASASNASNSSEREPRIIEFPQSNQLSTAESQANTVAEAEIARDAEADANPSLNAAGLPDGWVVQLGTFGDLDNASTLLRELLADDYRAYERKSQRDGREMSTILVGPVIDRAEADRLLTELAAKLNLTPLVKRYEREELR